MDSNLAEYYDMLRKTESATAQINEILSRKTAQEPRSKPVDKKGYNPNSDRSVHKYTLREVLKDCLERGPQSTS